MGQPLLPAPVARVVFQFFRLGVLSHVFGTIARTPEAVLLLVESDAFTAGRHGGFLVLRLPGSRWVQPCFVQSGQECVDGVLALHVHNPVWYRDEQKQCAICLRTSCLSAMLPCRPEPPVISFLLQPAKQLPFQPRTVADAGILCPLAPQPAPPRADRQWKVRDPSPCCRVLDLSSTHPQGLRRAMPC